MCLKEEAVMACLGW